MDEPVGGKLIRFLYCPTGGESFQFFEGFWYKKRTADQTHSRERFRQRVGASIQTSGCRASAALSQLGFGVKCAMGVIEMNNFPACHIHGVKVVVGAPSEVMHVNPRSLKPHYASPPKR